MRFSSCLFLTIIPFTILSCKKDVDENSHKYYFTTKLMYYVRQLPEGTVLRQYDSTIYYTGNLTYQSGNIVKIEYCPTLTSNPPYDFSAEGIIYPIVDSSGNLTYPDYWATYGYYFTGGKIEESGDVQIEMGANLYDRGYHQSIAGYKIN